MQIRQMCLFAPGIDFPISAQQCAFTTDVCITCVFPRSDKGQASAPAYFVLIITGLMRAHLQRDTRLHCLHLVTQQAETTALCGPSVFSFELP